MAVKGKITFSYVDQPKCRVVAFNVPVESVVKKFKFNKAGMLIGSMDGWTVKDFRSVDKTIYFAPGKVDSADMQQLIQMYNASLGQPGWKRHDLIGMRANNG